MRLAGARPPVSDGSDKGKGPSNPPGPRHLHPGPAGIKGERVGLCEDQRLLYNGLEIGFPQVIRGRVGRQSWGGLLVPAPVSTPQMLFWVTCLKLCAPDLEGGGRGDTSILFPSSQGWLVPPCHPPPPPAPAEVTLRQGWGLGARPLAALSSRGCRPLSPTDRRAVAVSTHPHVT